jgi:hypothetical protein
VENSRPWSIPAVWSEFRGGIDRRSHYVTIPGNDEDTGNDRKLGGFTKMS